jgi:hypothetical protein
MSLATTDYIFLRYSFIFLLLLPAISNIESNLGSIVIVHLISQIRKTFQLPELRVGPTLSVTCCTMSLELKLFNNKSTIRLLRDSFLTKTHGDTISCKPTRKNSTNWKKIHTPVLHGGRKNQQRLHHKHRLQSHLRWRHE